MYQIYFLEKYPTQSNAYAVSRTEKWTFRKEQCFEDLEEAKEYTNRKTDIHRNLFCRPKIFLG